MNGSRVRKVRFVASDSEDPYFKEGSGGVVVGGGGEYHCKKSIVKERKKGNNFHTKVSDCAAIICACNKLQIEILT
jgi:hypothetical protein